MFKFVLEREFAEFLGPIEPLKLGLSVGWLVFIENLHWELGNWGIGDWGLGIGDWGLGIPNRKSKIAKYDAITD